MRPALKAGLRSLWRDRDTLQIGVDPRRAIGLSGLGAAAAVVSLLDGSRDTAEVEHAASERGIPVEATRLVLRLLAGAGVLDDFPAALHRSLPAQLRARLGPDLACASLAAGDSDGGARTFARRRAAAVRVYGAGRVGACVATLLAASGVARVSCRDSGAAGYADLSPGGLGRDDIGLPRAAAAARAVRRAAPEARLVEDATRQPDLAVLTGPADPEEATALLQARVPHLAVHADEAIGVVGPLVIPGSSACLRCADLARAERDSAWPLILAQAAGPPRACDTVLAAGTAALAARQALAFLDQAGALPATLNGTLELVLPDWQWHRRTWLPHPACTCGAAGNQEEARDRYREGMMRSV
jgi:bacteriocin biosynthesis cyclodehydratase domain-containing protein